MTWLRRLAQLFRAPAAATTGAFDSAPKPIDQVIMEMINRSGTRVGRVEALGVPYILRGRNLLCSISTLPLVQYNRNNAVVRNPLLEQFDPDVPNVVHLAQTVEDLVFEGIAWWRVVGFGGSGLFPSRVRRLDPGTVSVDPPTGRSPAPLPSGIDPREPGVWVDGEFVSGKEIIRFDSPNPALLKVGGRSVKLAILLAKAAGVYADDPRPLDYFTPADGAEETSDDEALEIIAKWKAARKRRSTAWVPRALKYNTVDSPSPQQLQLVELLRQAGLEIANMLGIDPEDLGISTTSRTYFNATDRRQGRVNDVLAPYMRAITDRLSMGDVTPRGNAVRFDLTQYMRVDPITRVQYYQGLKALEAITVDEIRAAENMPPMPADEQPEPPPPADQPDGDPTMEPTDTVDAARRAPAVVLNGDQPMQFVDVPVRQFTVDSRRRIIEGLALPYGAVSASKYGYKFRFLRGSLKWSSVNRVKVMRDHDMSNPIGVAQNLTDMSAGLKVRLKVARGAAGDEALQLAEDGVLDGLSVGIDFDMSTDVEMDPNEDNVMLVRRADLREISLTAVPAFDDARVTKVAASRNGVSTMDECATCGQRHAPGTACPSQPPQNTPPAEPAPAGLTLSNDQVTALLSRPGALDALVQAQQQTQQPAQAAPEGGLTLSADQVDALIRSGRLGALLGLPQVAPQAQPEPARRETVDPTRRLSASVTREELPYGFDRKGRLTRGVKYDFSTDIIAGLRDGDGEALRRAEKFITAQFVTVSDAGPLNPNIQRPDLYVDQQDFTYPMWAAIEKGTIADATPFVLPKFSSSSGLVGAHTEGVEPAAGTFVATSQTITPSSVSGKVPITREAWDQGGNPQLSGLIWNQMLRAWFEALEASVVTLLDGLAPTTITLTTGATNSTLVSQIENELAKLQFIRGGFRMRDFFTQVDLYTKLIDAVDSNGKKLLPRVGPTNVSGTTSDFFADVIVGGLRGQPAWALAASGSVAANSYLFDRKDVSGWATAPNRLTFENVEVRFVHVGIWGYKALACTDLTGVRRISYDPVV